MISCRLCNQSKPLEDFYLSNLQRRHCSACISSRRRARINSNSPEAYLRLIHSQLKSQRKKTNLAWEITPEYLIEQYRDQGGRCSLSGNVMSFHRSDARVNKLCKNPMNISIERIDPAAGYVPGNITLVCLQANLMKSTMDADQFFFWISSISQHIGSPCRIDKEI